MRRDSEDAVHEAAKYGFSTVGDALLRTGTPVDGSDWRGRKHGRSDGV